MLADVIGRDKATCMRMDGAASLTPGTSRLLKGVTVPGCDLQAVLVLHLIQLGLRGLQSPASIAPTGIVSICVVQAVVLLLSFSWVRDTRRVELVDQVSSLGALCLSRLGASPPGSPVSHLVTEDTILFQPETPLIQGPTCSATSTSATRAVYACCCVDSWQISSLAAASCSSADMRASLTTCRARFCVVTSVNMSMRHEDTLKEI